MDLLKLTEAGSTKREIQAFTDAVPVPDYGSNYKEPTFFPGETWTRGFVSLHPDNHAWITERNESASFASRLAKYAGKHHHAVQFLPKSLLPVIPHKSGMLFLFEFVEEWEAATDMSALRQVLPELTAGQISNTMGFMRTLTQSNVMGVDLDEEIDDHYLSRPDVQEFVRKSTGEEEAVNVLDRM